MRHHLVYIFALCLLVITRASAQAPFTRDIWLNDANTPVKINCLEKDGTGFIWLGTDEGLYKYNGRIFTPVATIAGVSVTALAADSNRLIIGFEDGRLGLFENEHFTEYRLKGSLPVESISSIRVIKGNTFLAATVGSGLYAVCNGLCRQYNVSSGLSDDYLYTLAACKANTLLVATDQGINEVFKDRDTFRITHYTTANGLPDNIVRVIRPMKNKSLNWIGTHQGGIAFYCSKSRKVWTPFAENSWQWGQVNDILPIDTTRAWICTEEGYLVDARIDNQGQLSYRAHKYPQKLYRLLMDKTGNIWCATNSGVKQVLAEYISDIRLPAPYQLSDITAIACDNDTELWLAEKERLYKLSLRDDQHRLNLVYKFKAPVTQLYCQQDGVVWAGTFGDGLWYSKDHRRFEKVTNIQPLNGESILDVGGKADKLWVAGLNGVEEMKIETPGRLKLMKVHNKSTGTGSDYIYKIFTDSRDNIWMATDGAGVCRLSKNGQYTLWDSTAGMAGNVAYNIAEDAEGNIWASTFDKGLLMYDGRRGRNWICRPACKV